MTMEKRNAKMGHENAQVISVICSHIRSRSCQLGCLPCPESSPTPIPERWAALPAASGLPKQVTVLEKGVQQ
jgi:hypothetical protein